METNIRKAVLEDSLILAKLNTKCWQQAYRGLFADKILDNLDVLKCARGFSDRLTMQDGVIYIAEVEQQAVGFISSISSQTYSGVSEINSLYIEQSYWRQGIGEKLLIKVERQLLEANAEQLLVCVLSDNLRAINFYHKQGFVNTQIPKTFVISGCSYPELVLRKSLT